MNEKKILVQDFSKKQNINKKKIREHKKLFFQINISI